MRSQLYLTEEAWYEHQGKTFAAAAPYGSEAEPQAHLGALHHHCLAHKRLAGQRQRRHDVLLPPENSAPHSHQPLTDRTLRTCSCACAAPSLRTDARKASRAASPPKTSTCVSVQATRQPLASCASSASPSRPRAKALLLHDTDKRKPTCASVHTQAPVESGGRRAPGWRTRCTRSPWTCACCGL
jgi:hypothetical protein